MRLDTRDIYARLHWRTFSDADALDTGLLVGRELVMTKQLDESGLYVEYFDSLRVHGNNVACRWQILVNGGSCESPGPIAAVLFIEDSSDDAVNHHRPSSASGFCFSTNLGSIPAGQVNITVEVGPDAMAQHGDCHTGWQTTGHIIAREVPPGA